MRLFGHGVAMAGAKNIDQPVGLRRAFDRVGGGGDRFGVVVEQTADADGEVG